MADKTSYGQSLMHLIKGNLGAGILAMPASFAHTGLFGAIICVPLLCLVSTYCVHILVKSSQHISSKSKSFQISYSNLAKQSFEFGPECTKGLANSLGLLVDSALLITQVGVCCVYLVFVVDNITSILASYDIIVSKTWVFIGIFPITLLLSFIKTLKRLAVASLMANLLQGIGLALIVEYLVRDLDKVNLQERDRFRPISEMALGFGSAMFAFEGISVVLPLYSRLRYPNQMLSCFGLVNVAFFVILILYFIMGFFGYVKFGTSVKDSITLSLPAEPLYDAVRGMFTLSMLLTYPLQFYVPNEIVWTWAKNNLLKPSESELSVIRSIDIVMPPRKTGDNLVAESLKQVYIEPRIKPTTSTLATTTTTTIQSCSTTIMTNNNNNNKMPTASERNNRNSYSMNEDDIPTRYEYYCRALVVIITFMLAFSVPKLNLLMDLIGSFSGAALCLTVPAIVHLATYWDSTKGFNKVLMIIVNLVIIILSLAAGIGGSISSLVSIVNSFKQ